VAYVDVFQMLRTSTVYAQYTKKIFLPKYEPAFVNSDRSHQPVIYNLILDVRTEAAIYSGGV
jgi:hypothetical protein